MATLTLARQAAGVGWAKIAFLVCCVTAYLGKGADGQFMVSTNVVRDNELGILTQACTTSYCEKSTNPLDLWITLEQVCTLLVRVYRQ